MPSRPRSEAPAAAWRAVLLWLATAAAAFVVDWASLKLGRTPGQVSSIWPGDGMVLALMLARQGRGAGARLLAGALGALAAEGAWGDPPAVAAGLVLANTIGISGVFLGVRRWVRPELQRTRDVVALMGLATAGAAVSAAGGALVLGTLAGAEVPAVWARWALGDFLGYAVVGPPLMVLLARGWPAPAAPGARRRAALTLAAYAAFAALVFAQSRYPLLFLIPLGLFAVAYRLELEGVMLAVVITVVLGTGLSMAGRSPGALVAAPPAEQLLMLQVFLAVITVSFLPISAVLADRRRLEQALREARAAAEADAALKSEFLATISHELRTPLASVLGFASILKQRGRLGEEDREHAESISVAGSALLTAINDILAFSELEAGRLEVQAEPASIRETAAEAVRLVGPAAAGKGLAVDLRVDPRTPPAARLDRGRVRQVLLNLLGNAVKFTEAGAVTLEIGYEPAAGLLSAAVRDTGPGLEPGQLARLFDRFSRADAVQRRRHGGTGLGLAICKGLVEAMGGTIEAESQPGRGTVVRFRIPAPPAAPVAAPSRPGAAAMLRPRTRSLLLVGRVGEPGWARTVLAPLELDIAEAAGVQEGAALAAARAFDLVLAGGESLEDARALGRALRRADGASRGALLMAVGGEAPEALAAAGFDGYLPRPVSSDDLIGLVMGRQRRRARAPEA